MVVFLSFFYASCKDPGAILPEKKRTFLDLKPYDPLDKKFANIPDTIRNMGMTDEELKNFT